MKKFEIAAWAALLILLPVDASAGPVMGAIALVQAFAATSAWAAFVVRIGVSLALSALSAALQKKPGQQRRPGIKTEATTTGGVNPQSFILGKYATSGNMVAPPYSHPNSGGKPNKYLTYVVDVSDMPGVQFSRALVAGEYVTDLVASAGDHDQEGMFNGGTTPHFFMTWHDGSQTAADAYMLANYGAHPDRVWDIDMIGTGVSYAVVTFLYNRQVFNGLPGVRFEVDGIPLYDPRLDGSEAGTGAHRWNNPATWAFTENPMVMVYNILRGITLPDGKVWGGRASADDLPLDNWFAGMNECDQAISLAGGGTEPQYRAGLEVGVDDQPAAVIEELLKAASAEITEIGGVYKVRVGPPALPVYFFSDDDVVATEAQSLRPYPGLDGVHNAIHASHPAPDALWETRDAPPLYNATWEAEDGGRQLVASIGLPAVASDTQVQRLMAAWIKDERRFRRHNLTLPPDAAILEPLDTAAWTSAANGYSAKVFEIGELSDNLTTLLQTVALRERDASDFSWTPGADEITVTYTNTFTTQPVARTVPGWTVAPAAIVDAAGVDRRPALALIWDGTDMNDAASLEIEVRASGQTALVAQKIITDLEGGQLIVSEGIVAGQLYEARARLVMRRARAWTAWASATAPDVRFTAADVTPESLTWTELGQDVKDQIDSAGDANASAAAALASAALAAANQTAAETAQTASQGSATASAASASAADTHKNAAGVSASAAEISKLAADTAKAAAAISETNAAGSATSADGSKSAAEAARVLAVSAQGGAEAARVAAGVSETNAGIAEGNADDAAAGAVSARDVAAKVYSGQAYDNPIFARWDGVNPDGVTDVNQNSGSSVTKNTNGQYGNAIDLDTGTDLTADRPYIQFRGTSAEIELPEAESCAGLYFEIELHKVSGSGWGGANAKVTWVAGGTGGTDASVTYFFKDHMQGATTRQVLAADVARPAGYVAGNAAGYVKLMIYGTSNDGGYSRSNNKTRIHRVNMRALNTAASAMIQQTAITDLEGNALASLIMRTKAGTSDGSVEITSASNPEGGAASKVKMTGDVIEFDGMSVFNDVLKSSNFSTGSTGWRLKQDGSAEFANLVVRGWLQDGAVSDGAEYYSASSIAKGNGTTMGLTSAGTMATNQFWHVAVTCELRRAAYVQTGGSGTEKDPYTYAAYGTWYDLEWRTKDTSGSSWSSYSTLYTSPNKTGQTWADFSEIIQLMGNFYDVQFRFKFYTGGGVTPDQNNVREASIIAKSVTK